MVGLLADVVASRQLQPEPVATDALVHVLSRSSAGRRAMTKLFNEVAIGNSPALTFTSQVVSAEDSGRPDIVGSDHEGVRLIVEAKFDAELTVIQKSQAYGARLAKHANGALIFLVPRDRMKAIWPELLGGPGIGALWADQAWPDDAEIVTAELPQGHVLAVTSWEHVLGVLREAMHVAGENDNLGDIAQLSGLVDWRVRSGWTPLLPDDLSTRAGRQLGALINAVLSVAQTVSKKKTRAGSGDQGTGRYISTEGGHTLWVGIWFSWWGRYGTSPVWAQVRSTNLWPVDLIAERLSPIAGVVARQTHGDVVVPLQVRRGAEIEAVQRSLEEQLKKVSELVDSLPPSGEDGPDTLNSPESEPAQ